MQYPYLQEVTRYREMTNVFGGYCHRLSCNAGQFFDMTNMTSKYYPVLSPRQNRGIVLQLENAQGILDKEELMWIDNGKLYLNGEEVTLDGVTLSSVGAKTMEKMGAYVIIMPDKVWYNTVTGECGYMEASFNTGASDVSFTNCASNGSVITSHNEEYYKANEPKNGDYLLTTVSGKTSLKVYSSVTSSWSAVTSTYVQISSQGIGKNFEKGDGVQVSFNTLESAWEQSLRDMLGGVFVNRDVTDETTGDMVVSTNATIIDKTDDSITIAGISYCGTMQNMHISVERKVPDMEFITECNNRLWGCSRDGHEIYCCKLGDSRNWNSFQGISTDSWSATIGSDGKFTGATTYLGYPIFFKEDGLIKISISATGGHQIRETKCRGVQRGSERSLSILNETLYYKSTDCVCAYTGSLPIGISDDLGEQRYVDAVGGSIGDRYYISMKDKDGNPHMFAYDSKHSIWCREDDTEVLFFCRHSDELYFVDKADNKMKSVRGTTPFDSKEMEEAFDWMVESGNIGYSSPDNKYISRVNVRISLELGTNVDFYIQYDSDGKWEHKFNMTGKGTKTFTVPVIPKRCDHFKYKVIGNGTCKIHSITKTLEQGSDI